jgi:tetratricopeptide (TPR) repeat protein
VRQRATPRQEPAGGPSVADTELVCGGYLTAADLHRRLARMDDQSLFELLGVDSHASGEAVAKGYQAQLFIWHPDRLAPDQERLRPIAGRICARLSSAYQQLRDPIRRAEHRRAIEQQLGSARQQRAMTLLTEAAELAEAAQTLIRHGKLAEARAKLETAIALDAEPALYRVLLAWVQAEALGPPPALEAGKTSQRYRAQLDALDREIAADPRFERARYIRAQLLKRSGFVEEAMRDFRAAAKLNPRNIGATREVRIHEMRKRRSSRSWLERVFVSEPR